MGEQAMGITKIDAGLYVQTPDDPDLSDLTDDGDTVELDDGRTLRLRVEPDDIDPFEQFGEDAYGQIAQVRRSRDTGYTIRPDGFDGNAEIVWPPQNSDPYWWQPPSDGPKRGTAEFKQERTHVLDLLAFGMCGFVLELCEGTDAYGHPIVTQTASIWGIEPFPERDYKQEIIRDLWRELQQPDNFGEVHGDPDDHASEH